MSRLWGRQHPFERNHLQRSMTLLGLVGVVGMSALLLSERGVGEVLALALICGGALTGAAAVSRSRYVRETRLGFAVLGSRDGRFVLGSAAGLLVAAVLVAAVLLG